MRGLRARLHELLGWHVEAGSQEPASGPAAAVGPRAPWADPSDEFALALYGQLRGSPGNLLCSPFSIGATLAMAAAGARGETASQMGAVLRAPAGDDAPHLSFSDAVAQLGRSGRFELAVGNSVWIQEGRPLQPDYLRSLQRHAEVRLHRADFRRAAQTACEAINAWIAEATRGRISDLVAPGSLGPATRLVLANAVYFKGTWEFAFDADATRDEPFHLEDGGSASVPMMRQHRTLPHMVGEGFSALDLGYQGGELSLLVLLPDRRDGLADLERRLSLAMLRDCVARLESHEVGVFLPRFEFEWGQDLAPSLAALGMPLAFARGRADFSGIDGVAPPDAEALYASVVAHKALIEVNEVGTTAAAATAMIIRGAAVHHDRPRTFVFRADHPFLFALRLRRSGAVLFLGRLTDPRGHG